MPVPSLSTSKNIFKEKVWIFQIPQLHQLREDTHKKSVFFYWYVEVEWNTKPLV